MIQTSRRSLITGLVSFLAAPAVVRAASLMPVKALLKPLTFQGVPIFFDGGFPKYTDFAGYRMWITGKDNAIHCEPIDPEKFYLSGYDLLDK